MLIPFNTDAPIYYLPFATTALILLNIAMFIATMLLVTEGEPLSFG